MTVSRKVLGTLSLLTFLTGAAAWSIAQQLPQNAAPVGKIHPAPKPAPAKITRPTLNELNPAQRAALEPLAAEWNTMEAPRKQKWLEIANRFARMKPDEQQRMHEKMREWMRLTPEQRRTARETYTRTKKLDAATKVTEWDKYQQLPEEQKKALAEKAASKKVQVAALPSPSQAKIKTVEPIKKKATSGASAPLQKPAATTVLKPAQAPATQTPAAQNGQPAAAPAATTQAAPPPVQQPAQPPVATPTPPPVNQPANAK
jgi:hypothetical protein